MLYMTIFKYVIELSKGENFNRFHNPRLTVKTPILGIVKREEIDIILA